MKRKNLRAAACAFIITLIVFGTAAGFLLADHHTAYMTFGTDTRPLLFSTENSFLISNVDNMSAFQRLLTLVPVRFRAMLWLERLELDTVAYWIEQILS